MKYSCPKCKSGLDIQRTFNKKIMISCEKCGFKHLENIPSQEELQNYYDEKYYCESNGANLISLVDKNQIRREYQNLHYDHLLSLIRYRLYYW